MIMNASASGCRMCPMSHVSHRWDDNNDTGEELGGVCAIWVEIAQSGYDHKWLYEYYGDHVAIIAGHRYDYGEDPGEIIIEDPVVIEIIC